ncbi:MAG: pseudouridine synthase [Terriglobales bacterium]
MRVIRRFTPGSAAPGKPPRVARPLLAGAALPLAGLRPGDAPRQGTRAGAQGIPKPARKDKPEMTLDRALSRAGVASRTVAAELIRAGRVSLDGRVCRDPAAWVAPARQRLGLDGHPLRHPRPCYWALHKPAGVICSHGDKRGRKTIYDLAGPLETWYFSVGRLDQDSSGLLLLTNDSVFAERVASPEHKVAKTYHARVEPVLPDAALERLRGGLDIGRGEHTTPAKVRRLPRRGAGWIAITLREGKNRQVRRMVEAVGGGVRELIRVRIGKLALGALPEGCLLAIRPDDVL